MLVHSLVDAGVAGLRVDAGKHQYPDHLADIIGRVNNTAWGKLMLALEAIDMDSGEAVHASDYTHIGRVVNFIYGEYVSAAVRRLNNFKYFGNFGQTWDMWANDDVVVCIDNHDSQRGHGGSNSPLTYKDSYSYTMAVTYMLSWPYGLPRVMSSYYFTDSDRGPPSDGNGMATSPYFRSDETCDPKSGWVCEHRWPEIRRMTLFRRETADQKVHDIVTDDNRIAYRLGNKGFFAVNNNPGQTWTNTFQTGLPGGSYCDIISGEPTDTGCTGTAIGVGSDGNAQISINQGKTLALHLGAKSGSGGPTPQHHKTTKTKKQSGVRRKTMVYLKKSTSSGQNVFIRGGAKCASGQCSIPISDVTTDTPAKCGADFVKWAAGDNQLDWTGADPGQAAGAEGTPMWYTTSSTSSVCYDCENAKESLGDGYWKAEMMMDCSKTNGGWFEFKGYMNWWEGDISQDQVCSGSEDANTPYTSKNHLAKCGAINIFQWGTGSCKISKMESCP